MPKFKESPKFKAKLNKVLGKILVRGAVYLSVLNLSTRKPIYAGFQDEDFVYPASLYKLYVAMGVLDEVKRGRLKLGKKVLINKKNAVDKKKEVPSDPRPLLTVGMRMPIAYLLDLMITRSDNTAANVLIDIVTRERINRLVRKYGWRGSEVTRKFLPRSLEDKKYRKARATISSTRHFTEFLYLLQIGKLVDGDSSALLKELLSRQLDRTKMKIGLPKSAKFAHKTGWFSYLRDGRLVGVCGDCGIVESGKRRYIVCCIVVLPDKKSEKALQIIGKRIDSLM